MPDDLTYGHLAEMLLRVPPRERRLIGRFLESVVVDVAGCWLWQGEILRNGYGRFAFENRRELAHRFAYRMLRGAIADGLVIDHLCRVRPCCNPAHLEPVTNAENQRRGDHPSSRTHCPSGHAYDETNTRIYEGRRHCRRCNNAGGSGRLTTGSREVAA